MARRKLAPVHYHVKRQDDTWDASRAYRRYAYAKRRTNQLVVDGRPTWAVLYTFDHVCHLDGCKYRAS